MSFKDGNYIAKVSAIKLLKDKDNKPHYLLASFSFKVPQTLVQLNFFRWAISYNIIKYTEENYRTIINKLSHVNSYFKKHVVENTSFSTTDDNSKSTSDSADSKSNLSNEDEKKSCIELNKKDKKIKFKNPIVSRNIFLEL